MVIDGRKAINNILFIIILLNAVQEFVYSVSASLKPISYLTDVFLMIAFFIMVMLPKGNKIDKIQTGMWLLFLTYVVFSFAWSSLNYHDAAMRIRHILQCTFVLYLTQRYLTQKGLKNIVNMLCIVQLANTLLSFYQNRIMGLYADYCNGLFGYTGYGSGSVGMFSVALSILAIIYYLYGEWSAKRSIFIVGISAIFCAFAEVKAYYIVLIMGIGLVFILQKKSKKSVARGLLIAVAVSVIFSLAYIVLSIVFPNNLATLFSVTDYVRYDSRSTYAGRLNAIPFILKNQFMGDFLVATIGSGIGTSAKNYIYELGKTFADLGFIGLGLLISSFLSPLITHIKAKRTTAEQFFVLVLSLLMIVGIDIWNVPFIRSIGIIMFFFLGIASVRWSGEKNV